MRNIVFLLILFAISTLKVYAQDSAYLDINNVKAGIHSSGELFHDLDTYQPMLQWSKNNPATNLQAIGNLWIGGLDAGGQLRLTAQTYRQGGTDTWPGPLDSITATITSAVSAQWNRVWKINKSTIDSFKLGLYSSVPSSIASWPAHGDPAYNQDRYLAPFFDNNMDGQYIPQDGDYPIIKGDQAVYFIYNDNLQGGTHQTGTPAFGMEIHGMAYAFNCSDSSLSNTMFVNYRIFNRSTFGYYNVYTGTWLDMDLFNNSGDFSGSDSLLDLSYAYDNGTDAVGIIMLSPSLSSSMAYSNDFTATGNPTTAASYYNYLQGKWADGTSLTYGGTGYGGTSPTSFIYTGDPVIPSGWVDLSLAADRRYLSTAGPYTVYAGGVISMEVAYVFAQEYSSNNIQCVNKLKQQVQNIRTYYANDTTPCGGSFSSVTAHELTAPGVLVYPNPSDGAVHVKLDADIRFDFELFDQMGRRVLSINDQRGELYLENKELSSGMYYYRIIPKGKYSAVSGKLVIQ